ncbi:MAG: hypothetical protein NBV68_16845 [Erythrobacter sp.]|uniref:hypothetical protein n=1 Tax=Erythrobacter sp. TaxID=1042 RepID=UPI0025DF4374|nr:hypothetical protein [Erythrobacter sp.]MCM0001043.1 hypothetical protein [Erythrobacter sp.]
MSSIATISPGIAQIDISPKLKLASKKPAPRNTASVAADPNAAACTLAGSTPASADPALSSNQAVLGLYGKAQ